MPPKVIIGNPILNEVDLNVTSEGLIASSKLNYLLSMNIRQESEYEDESTIYSDKIKTLIENYKPEVKKERNAEMRLQLTDETPVFKNSRRLSPMELEIVEKQIDEWLKQKIIQPSSSDFASPIVLAQKKDGSYRICLDYRKLNKKIIKEHYPLPLIEDQIDGLRDANFFSILDLENGFMHVNVGLSSQKYTSFVKPQHSMNF